jgi:macrolide transport system ATP-binding/permease protein
MMRIGGLFAKSRREREMVDEIQSHLQMHIDDNLQLGMTQEEARRNAVLRIGGLESAKEACRERNTMPWIENLGKDLHFAFRQFKKNTGFTCTAILVLALGICASVAIFAFVDAALIQPLPYEKPNRLVGVYESTPRCPECDISYPDYLDFKRLNKVFRSLDAYQQRGVILTTPEGAQPARSVRVTDGFFQTLGIAPVIGRVFYAGEDLPAAPRTVILSHGAWQNRYGGNPGIVGQTVILDDAPHTVIGVLPQTFQFALTTPAEFWTPLHATGQCDVRRSCHSLNGVARLEDGVSIESALANMTGIAKQLEQQYPDSNRGQGASVLALSEVIGGNLRPILMVLMTGAALLLLIACINVASLLLVRSESRSREFAVRSAIGASRGRLLCQFLTEGFLLAAIGGSIGAISAGWVMQLITKLVPADLFARMPYLQGLGLNLRVWGFALAISLCAAILFSVIPTLRLSVSRVSEGLAEGSRGSAGRTWSRLGSRLVVLELATAMVLLVGAGLLGKSLYQLLQVDIGFRPDHLATVQVTGPQLRYGKDEQAIALAREVVGRVAVLPGVQSVSTASTLPVGCDCNTDWVRIVGKPWNGEHNELNEREVSSTYFATLHARLLRGRNFTEADDSSRSRVVIVNEAMARLYFPGEDPVGRQLADNALSPKSMREIIGVVGDIREGSLDRPVAPAEYLPFNQNPDNDFILVVRTSQSEQSLLPALVATVHGIDRSLVTSQAGTMGTRINNSQSAYLHRSSAWLVGGFAAMALLLSVVGLYGVVAYSVSQRTREIGVRMALGADSISVCRLILKQAGWLTGLGVGAGLALSAAAASLIRGLLFGVTSWDAPTLCSVAAVLGVAALIASYIPARRAASINPVEALRTE